MANQNLSPAQDDVFTNVSNEQKLLIENSSEWSEITALCLSSSLREMFVHHQCESALTDEVHTPK